MYSDTFRKHFKNIKLGVIHAHYNSEAGIDTDWFIHHPKSDRIECFISHHHEVIELLYVTEGSMRVQLNDQSYQLNRGEIILFNPFEPHQAEFDKNIPAMRYADILIDPTFFIPPGTCDFRDWMRWLQNGEVRFDEIYRDEPQLRDILERIIACYDAAAEEDVVYNCRILALIYELFAFLFEHHCTDDVGADCPSRDLRFIRQVVSYTYKHYKEPISTTTICEELSYNMNHFCRMIKANFDSSYTQYLCQYRVERAALNYRRSTLTINEIAAEVGFNDYGYFAKSFKKYIGMSPAAYFLGRG